MYSMSKGPTKTWIHVLSLFPYFTFCEVFFYLYYHFFRTLICIACYEKIWDFLASTRFSKLIMVLSQRTLISSFSWVLSITEACPCYFSFLSLYLSQSFMFRYLAIIKHAFLYSHWASFIYYVLLTFCFLDYAAINLILQLPLYVTCSQA